jgi:hypothetical protein
MGIDRGDESIRARGEGGWDYLTVGASVHRLYVSRATHVKVVDTRKKTAGGVIPDAPGVHGIAPQPKGIGGGTVAAIFRRIGPPAVVYSNIDESAHQPDEHCGLDDLIADGEVFASVAMSCTAEGRSWRSFVVLPSAPPLRMTVRHEPKQRAITSPRGPFRPRRPSW